MNVTRAVTREIYFRRLDEGCPCHRVKPVRRSGTNGGSFWTCAVTLEGKRYVPGNWYMSIWKDGHQTSELVIGYLEAAAPTPPIVRRKAS